MLRRDELCDAVIGVLLAAGPAYESEIVPRLGDEYPRHVRRAVRHLVRLRAIGRDHDGRLSIRMSLDHLRAYDARVAQQRDRDRRTAERNRPLRAAVEWPRRAP